MIVLGGVSSVTAYISLSRRFNNRLELKLGFIKSQTRKMPNSMVAVVSRGATATKQNLGNTLEIF